MKPYRALKPRVLTKCVANSYTGPTERIVEFSSDTHAGAGGLIRLANTDEGLLVQVYRVTKTRVMVSHDDKRERYPAEPINDEQAGRAGRAIAILLHLKRDRDGRYATAWGTKTDVGLGHTIARILSEKTEG